MTPTLSIDPGTAKGMGWCVRQPEHTAPASIVGVYYGGTIWESTKMKDQPQWKRRREMIRRLFDIPAVSVALSGECNVVVEDSGKASSIPGRGVKGVWMAASMVGALEQELSRLPVNIIPVPGATWAGRMSDGDVKQWALGFTGKEKMAQDEADATRMCRWFENQDRGG